MSQLHIENDPEPVFLVFCPGRASQAAIKPTMAAAQDTAERLALAYPGHEFMVFESTFVACAARPPRAPGAGGAAGAVPPGGGVLHLTAGGRLDT